MAIQAITFKAEPTKAKIETQTQPSQQQINTTNSNKSIVDDYFEKLKHPKNIQEAAILPMYLSGFMILVGSMMPHKTISKIFNMAALLPLAYGSYHTLEFSQETTNKIKLKSMQEEVESKV